MKKNKLVLLLLIFLIGCTGFGYKYYGLIIQDKECYKKGTLLASDPKNDKPLEICEPDSQIKGKCVVMLTDDFFDLKKNYERLKIELKECQKRCQ